MKFPIVYVAVVVVPVLAGCVKEPTACFKANQEVRVNEPLQFTSCCMNGYDFWWDFGDKSFSDEENPAHVYGAPGKYLVTLKVSSRNGQKRSMVSRIITVWSPESVVRAPQDFNRTLYFAADAFNIFRSAKQGGNYYKQNLGCSSVLVDTLASPRRITVNFGSSNCLSRDGRYRKGKIIITFEGGLSDFSSPQVVTFSDYHVNDKKISGSMEIRYHDLTYGPLPVWQMDFAGLKVTVPQGASSIMSASVMLVHTSGSNTPELYDDFFSLTGTAFGTDLYTEPFTAVVKEKILFESGCNWFTGGEVSFTPDTPAPRMLHYGDGSCDNRAEVKQGANRFVLTLD